MSFSQKLTLYFALAFSGFAVMVYELIMPRLLAPYVGTSYYIWTIVIGIVLASLSLGSYLGGLLAMRRPHATTLATALLSAALTLISLVSIQDWVIIAFHSLPLITATTISSLILLAPTSVLLGLVTPLVIQLLQQGERETRTIPGRVIAISIIGSIIGTVATGFWLIPTFPLTSIMFGIALTLSITALILATSYQLKITAVSIAALSLYLLASYHSQALSNFLSKRYGLTLVTELNTLYSHIWIHDNLHTKPWPTRTLSDVQSSIYLNTPIATTFETTQSYYSLFNLAHYFSPTHSSVLMLGGGAYTYADYYLENYPKVNVTVVEIDPVLQQVAVDYFGLTPTPRFHPVVSDGRSYLNRNADKFDIIFLDTYREGSSIPFELTTREAFVRMYEKLEPGGSMFVNIISSLEGSGSHLLHAQYHTLTSVFDHVILLPTYKKSPVELQNYVLIGLKSPLPTAALTSPLPRIKNGYQPVMVTPPRRQNLPLLTDNYAPVEYYDLLGRD